MTNRNSKFSNSRLLPTQNDFNLRSLDNIKFSTEIELEKSNSLSRERMNVIIENNYSNQGSGKKLISRNKIADKFKSMKSSIHSRFLAASKRYVKKKIKFENKNTKFGIGALEAAQKAVRKSKKAYRDSIMLSDRT